MHGLKMRMPNLEIMVEIGNYLGFAVTPMSMTEVFSALEQGVIDGQENPPSTIRSQGWYEIQDYLLVSNHVFTSLFLCVNNDFYNSLDSELQNILDEVIDETCSPNLGHSSNTGPGGIWIICPAKVALRFTNPPIRSARRWWRPRLLCMITCMKLLPKWRKLLTPSKPFSR